MALAEGAYCFKAGIRGTCNTAGKCVALPVTQAPADVDECAKSDTNDCAADATCTNTKGGFTCKCKQGFAGDGKKCTEVDECAKSDTNDCAADATCTNTKGGFTCKCKQGFVGDGKKCSAGKTTGLEPGRP